MTLRTLIIYILFSLYPYILIYLMKGGDATFGAISLIFGVILLGIVLQRKFTHRRSVLVMEEQKEEVEVKELYLDISKAKRTYKSGPQWEDYRKNPGLRHQLIFVDQQTNNEYRYNPRLGDKDRYGVWTDEKGNSWENWATVRKNLQMEQKEEAVKHYAQAIAIRKQQDVESLA